MNVRNYPVPRRVASAALRSAVHAGVTDSAVRAARRGKVRGYHLSILAGGSWSAGSEWAQSVLEREQTATDRRRDALLAAAGYDPEEYVYQGVLDPGYPDHEMIVSVARQAGYDSPLERWDGLDWGTSDVSPDGLRYLVLDEDVLADVLDAIDTGSAGVMLRPFEPRAWVRDAQPMDIPILAAAPPPRHTDAMIAFPIDADTANSIAVDGGLVPDELHLTLAYLGDVEENAVDFQAVQRATAKWARRMTELSGRISEVTNFETDADTANVGIVDCDGIQEARALLVKLLESEGVEVDKRHPTYTPHVTLAYDAEDPVPVPAADLYFDAVQVHYGDDVQRYPLGEAVVAAGGAGPDIFYAIVDEFDTSAVLDLIRVLPGPVAYRRTAGKWAKDNQILLRLMGADPPPVVEVDPAQAEDVLSQVDAYDSGHPDALTAAVPWDESKYKRAGGKFAKKDGAAAPEGASKPGKTPTKGPKRPQGGRGGPLGDKDVDGRGRDGAGPSPAAIRNKPWLALKRGNDANHHDLDMGLGPEFWDRQPKGFREWLVGFLQEQAAADRPDKTAASDDGKGADGKQSGEAGDGKRDVAKGDQRSAEAKAAQQKAASEGGKKAGAKNLDAWRKHIPQRFKKAFEEFTEAAAMKAGSPRQGQIEYGPKQGVHQDGRVDDVNRAGDPTDGAQAAARRIERLDKADRDFDEKFAKEGLGESHRREIFDRQLAGAAGRLAKSGIDARRVERVLKHKVEAEQQQRADFERRRRTAAEQERVRRLSARNRESDAQAVTADASFMPAKLKKYWLRGEGAAKVRWGVGGDFNRCVKALAKYLDPGRIKGACANLHHLATGFYPGPGRDH